MIKTIIQKNTYQDSITLMLLTNAIDEIDGVQKVSIMMATPANKDIFAQAGFKTAELDAAGNNDIAILLDVHDEDVVSVVLEAMEEFLDNQGTVDVQDTSNLVKNWEGALNHSLDTNVAQFSIPGQYAADEVETALDAGKHVFLFSDNMDIEDEVRLKQLATEKGLLLMGPDCGTSFISGVPFAFTNMLKKGNIGVVGASGTGIQEVTTQIVQLGGGISHAIGTGGRDLSAEVGGLTMKAGIVALNEDPLTEVLVVISKPPAKEVRLAIEEQLQSIDKPAVAIFIGEKPENHQGNISYAYTLEEAAKLAVNLSKKESVEQYSQEPLQISPKPLGTKIYGLYAGGTLANEAGMLIADALDVELPTSHEKGYMLDNKDAVVIDLGDDFYTQGKPHPMIDPQNRIEMIEKISNEEPGSIILMDLVLGYGANEDMASTLAQTIENVRKKNEETTFIVTICGTEDDPQNYAQQKKILESVGAIVATSNVQAILTALDAMDKTITFPVKTNEPYDGEKVTLNTASEALENLLNLQPRILNIGLKRFNKPFDDLHIPYVQFDWQPVAGGNVQLQKAINFLNKYVEESK